jgi:hypothetical protein
LRSRFNSCFSSRPCSFFSCFVSFPAGEVAGVDVAFDDDVDVDVTVGDGEAEGIGSILRG